MASFASNLSTAKITPASGSAKSKPILLSKDSIPSVNVPSKDGTDVVPPILLDRNNSHNAYAPSAWISLQERQPQESPQSPGDVSDIQYMTIVLADRQAQSGTPRFGVSFTVYIIGLSSEIVFPFVRGDLC